MLLGEGDMIADGGDLGWGFSKIFKKAVALHDPRKLIAKASPKAAMRNLDPRAHLDPRKKLNPFAR
jgi:hypothetical protein